MDAKEFFGEWSEVIDFDILDGILAKLGSIIATKEISPAPEDLFRVFGCCPYSKLKLVICGQDPYPQKNIGTGIAFGNKEGTKLENYSPSLRVLYDAVEKYCSDDLPFSYIDETFPTLESWCKQGILLLNSALSVEIGKPSSHSMLWWPFTKSLLQNIENKNNNIIFVLMGQSAGTFSKFLKEENVITCGHPSYYARTGEEFPNIFIEVDKKLKERGVDYINWY